MAVPILKQGDVLIASIQLALTDVDLRDAARCPRRKGLATTAHAASSSTSRRWTYVDSFASRTLRDLAHMIRLRGAETVIVGIQPDVAFAMVQLGLTLEDICDGAGSRGRAGLSRSYQSAAMTTGDANSEVRVPIASSDDVVVARQKGRALAAEIGFSASEATLIAAAISELARNIVKYAGSGEILLASRRRRHAVDDRARPRTGNPRRPGRAPRGILDLRRARHGLARRAPHCRSSSKSSPTTGGTTVTVGKYKR